MRHCCQFKADDIYYLNDTDLFSSRILSVGFCPVCQKPVAELIEWRFDGVMNKQSVSGINAQNMLIQFQNDIVYSVRELNYKKLKSKPYGWKYGLNRSDKNGRIRQYACDFYGNKELVKSI
jgi:hypothetical protein